MSKDKIDDIYMDVSDPDDKSRQYSIKAGAHDSNSICKRHILLVCIVLHAIVIGICVIIFAIHVSTATDDIQNLTKRMEISEEKLEKAIMVRFKSTEVQIASFNC